jgi:hypothetical protein
MITDTELSFGRKVPHSFIMYYHIIKYLIRPFKERIWQQSIRRTRSIKNAGFLKKSKAQKSALQSVIIKLSDIGNFKNISRIEFN